MPIIETSNHEKPTMCLEEELMKGSGNPQFTFGTLPGAFSLSRERMGMGDSRKEYA